MSTGLDVTAAHPRTVPLHRIVPGLLRDPLDWFEEVGRRSQGEIVRLNLGTFRPYLVTHPDHVQHVFRDNAANYIRDGMLWKPLSRLTGSPSEVDPAWPAKWRAFRNLVSGPNIAAFTNGMAARITKAVDELGARAGTGRPVDSVTELTRIVYHAVAPIFVGDKITTPDAEKLGRAMTVAANSSFRARLLFPFAPHWLPMPGDRTFHRAVRTVDEVVLPLVGESRRHEAEGDDVVSLLLRERTAAGEKLTERQIRDGVAALFVGGSETTVTVLTFLWAVLAARPDIAGRLYDEIDRVVGTDQPTREHVPELRYTKMVLQEMLRVYSAGWILPRKVAADDVIDGVRIKKGAVLAVSPYLTHRLPEFWPRPEVFDPERFGSDRPRHRFSFLTFGAGPHQCVGSVLFIVEAQLILAAMISRLRPALHGSVPLEPQLGLTLKPRRPIEIVFGSAVPAARPRASS